MSLEELKRKEVIEFRGKRYPIEKLYKKVLGRPKLYGVILGNIAVIIFAMILMMLFFMWFFSFFLKL